jgi:hypothetical protein
MKDYNKVIRNILVAIAVIFEKCGRVMSSGHSAMQSDLNSAAYKKIKSYFF